MDEVSLGSFGIMTCIYTSPRDQRDLQLIYHKYKSKNLNKQLAKREQMIIEQKHDVFGLGVVFYAALNQGRSFPYYIEKEGDALIPDPFSPYKDIEGVPKDINDLIKGMVTFNHKERYSAYKALEHLQRIMGCVN